MYTTLERGIDFLKFKSSLTIPTSSNREKLSIKSKRSFSNRESSSTNSSTNNNIIDIEENITNNLEKKRTKEEDLKQLKAD